MTFTSRAGVGWVTIAPAPDTSCLDDGDCVAPVAGSVD